MVIIFIHFLRSIVLSNPHAEFSNETLNIDRPVELQVHRVMAEIRCPIIYLPMMLVARGCEF